MTIYGWDQSHFDGAITQATMVQAKAEGIEFVTHKLGEGLTTGDSEQATALAAARDAGITVIGGYWFCHNSDNPVAEAHACVAMADRLEPWWRDFGCWFWQPDCETETGQGKPTRDWIKTFADQLTGLTGRPSVVYASHGEYGNSLAGVGHPLWNANYGSNPHGQFKSVYPGDSSAGWSAYSGQTPVFLQYGSNTTIAGKTTCDANAYRGTLDDLHTLLGGTMTTVDLTPAAVQAVADQVWANKIDNGLNTPMSVAQNEAFALSQWNPANPAVVALRAELDALKEQNTQILALLQAAPPVPVVGGVIHVAGDLTVTEPA